MSVAIDETNALAENVFGVADSLEPDAALVEAARRREPQAFKEIVTKYGPRIFHIAQKITRNREDAEEVSQDSFARAFLRMDTFRGDSRFYTWLARIAINQALMKIRARRPVEVGIDRPAVAEDARFSAIEVVDQTPTPEQRCSQAELQRILARAIGDLPMTLRDVLLLREVEECSTEETARMLGLSISAVKSRAVRGRQKLRRTLTRYFRQVELARFSGTNVV